MKRFIFLPGQNFFPYWHDLRSTSIFNSYLKASKRIENESHSVEVGKKVQMKVLSKKESELKKSDKRSKKSKSLIVKPEINHNDMQIKLKQIHKFLEKGLLVSLRIDNTKNIEGSFEKIFSQVEKYVIEQKVPGKISTTGLIINISPIIDDKNKPNDESNISSDLKSESENKS